MLPKRCNTKLYLAQAPAICQDTLQLSWARVQAEKQVIKGGYWRFSWILREKKPNSRDHYL